MTTTASILARWQRADVIERVVTGARTVAIVGASPDPSRPSHEVAAYLHGAGLRVYGVNPALESLFGEPAYRSLADLPEPVDVVDVFRRREYVDEVAEQAIALGAKALWLQLGVVNSTAAKKAAEAGLDVVMDRCLKVEHRRLVRQ